MEGLDINNETVFKIKVFICATPVHIMSTIMSKKF